MVRPVLKELLSSPSSIGLVGAQNTPTDFLPKLSAMGFILVQRGFHLVSGNAIGADQAWLDQASKAHPELCTVCLPWRSYEASKIQKGVRIITDFSKGEMQLAASNHDYWLNLSDGQAKMLIRNAGIVTRSAAIFGYIDPSKKGGGGTGHTKRCADYLGVPFWDLATTIDYQEVNDWFNSSYKKPELTPETI